MADKQDLNPFDPRNFVSGGGLWEGKVVTILGARAILDPMKYGDGSPVLDQKTNEPIISRVLEIIGIADGDENERRETYSSGSLGPTSDGFGFLKPDGTPGFLGKSSAAGRFIEAAVAGGFDVGVLWDGSIGRQKLNALVGARFLMKGEAKKDAKGNEKVNKKGYTEKAFYPVKFEGFKAGVSASTGGNGAAASGGNGAVSEELHAKAVDAVVAVLSGASDGKLSRMDLVRGLGKHLAGDADSAKVIALVAKESFHNGAPWKRDGTSFSL